jgi:hypothetical protein
VISQKNKEVKHFSIWKKETTGKGAVLKTVKHICMKKLTLLFYFKSLYRTYLSSHTNLIINKRIEVPHKNISSITMFVLALTPYKAFAFPNYPY